VTMTRYRVITVAVVAWVGIAITIVYILGSVNVPTLMKLARNPAQASATVILTDCQYHASVYYHYLAGGKNYTGRAQMGEECKLMKSGDKLSIYYVKTDPSISGYGDPSKRLKGELTVIGLIAVFFPSAILFILILQRNGIRRLF
jgi:hypothetical protein